jgi:hypothetical protein
MVGPPVFPAGEKVRIVFSILTGEMTVAEARSRTSTTVRSPPPSDRSWDNPPCSEAGGFHHRLIARAYLPRAWGAIECGHRAVSSGECATVASTRCPS